jgi:hypothetical protein
MALDGTVKLPVFGTVRKKTAAGAGLGAVVLVIGIYWYRQHKAASASPAASPASSATVTDPAGNVCSAVNPATGFCPGTAQDIAAQQQAEAGYYPYVDGGGSGSPFGLTTGTAPVETTAEFANNAAWAQASETYLGSNGADAIAAALAKYISGQQITTDQQTTVEEAIAAEGYPPVAGANGYPPSMNVTGGSSGTTAPVPNVTGMTTANAVNAIRAAGFVANPTGTGIVVSQTPAAGSSFAQGGTVDIGSRTPTVPKVTGLATAAAVAAIQAAGFTPNPTGTGTVVSQTPAAGAAAAPGSTVDIGSR